MTPAPSSSEALRVVSEALAGRPAWVVGGAVRDLVIGRPVADVDLVVDDDVEAAARAVGRAARAAVFPLSEAFGAWRVVPRDHAWQADLSPLHGGSIEEDLARRDLTVNAMAVPIASATDPEPVLIDPFAGRRDLGDGLLRMAGEDAFGADPLRTLRVARLAGELALEPDRATVAAARKQAGGLAGVAAERVWAELRRIVAGPDPLRGLAIMEELGLVEAVLPELAALRGISQSHYHHLDVHDHTLEVLGEVLALEMDPGAALGSHAVAVSEHLAQPVADELDGWGALRFGALLHDAAKPMTRQDFGGGRVGFPGHDARGADVTRAVLSRLKTSERLRAHVSALALHHLRCGFLVHERPLTRRAVHRYLRETAPVSVDVTVLSVADRLATRGRKSDEAISRHLDLARELLGEALAPQPAEPLWRGDELARALDLRPGPELGRLLGELDAARFAGEVSDRDEALAHAREWLGS